MHSNWRCCTCALHHQLRATLPRQVWQGTAASQAIDAAAAGVSGVPRGYQHGRSFTQSCCNNQSAQGVCSRLTRALSRADRKIGTIVTMSTNDCQLKMYLQKGNGKQVCATYAALPSCITAFGCQTNCQTNLTAGSLKTRSKQRCSCAGVSVGATAGMNTATPGQQLTLGGPVPATARSTTLLQRLRCTLDQQCEGAARWGHTLCNQFPPAGHIHFASCCCRQQPVTPTCAPPHVSRSLCAQHCCKQTETHHVGEDGQQRQCSGSHVQ